LYKFIQVGHCVFVVVFIRSTRLEEVMHELTDDQLDQISGGQTGQGVATAFVEGGTTKVLNALPGLINATEKSGVNPPGHGTITAAAVHTS
jgi:bacteriocin-like protein